MYSKCFPFGSFDKRYFPEASPSSSVNRAISLHTYGYPYNFIFANQRHLQFCLWLPDGLKSWQSSMVSSTPRLCPMFIYSHIFLLSFLLFFKVFFSAFSGSTCFCIAVSRCDVPRQSSANDGVCVHLCTPRVDTKSKKKSKFTAFFRTTGFDSKWLLESKCLLSNFFYRGFIHFV